MNSHSGALRSSMCSVGIVLVLALVACGDDADSADDPCNQLVDTSFTSEQPGGAVLLEGGPEPSTDELEFYEDEAWWWSGDTVETGSWTCASGEVTWLDGSFEGELDLEDGRLVITEPDGYRWIGPATTAE